MGASNSPDDVINRAKSNGFKSGLHYEEDKKKNLKIYEPATIAAQDQVLHKYAIWSFRFLNDKYITDFIEYEAKILCEDASLPEVQQLKDFWRFYKDQARGRIKKRPTAKSLKANAKSFNAGFTRRTGKNVPADTIAEINLWIGNKLVSEEDSGVVNVERPKYNYKPQDLDRNLKALWTRSDIKVRHERERFQFHFLLLLFCDSGARRGGLFTAEEDFHLVLERGQDGMPRFFFQLVQRTVKNNKDPKNKQFGVARREHRLLRYNATFFLIHFAIADGALDYDFFKQVLEGKGDGPIEWNEAAQELPVCRAVDRNGSLTSKAMTFPVFERVLKQLFMVEYDYIRASMHMIRRELGLQLDKRYSETQRSQHVLHKDNRIFGQSYMAFVSSCDGLAAFLREDADHTAVDYFQGLDRFHQPGMPVKLPAAMSKQVGNSAELANYDNEIKGATSSDGRAKAQKARQNAIKRLREKALQEHRRECLKALRKDRLINGCHTASSIDPLNEVFPEKRRISEAMISDSEEFSVMKDALRLLTMSSDKYHRDGEGPVDGSCPFCYEDVSRLLPRNLHIHHCRRKTVAQELGVLFSTLKFCYFCNEFYTPKQWEQDCRRHLSTPLVYCGSLTYRHTLLRPAFCLLCAQSNDLTAAERLKYWDRDVQALDHIDQFHGWHWVCLHCKFTSTKKESGRDHLYDAHGYQFRAPKVSGTQPMAIDHQLLAEELPSHMDCDQSEKSLGVPYGHCRLSPDLEEDFLETTLGEKVEPIDTSDDEMIDPALLCNENGTCPDYSQYQTPDLSDDLDEFDVLMNDCISFPVTPPSEPTPQGLKYIQNDPTIDQVDYKAPYFLLPSLFDTDNAQGQLPQSPKTLNEIKWECPSELDYAQYKEQPDCITESPTGTQIVVKLRSAPTREEFQFFNNISSLTNETMPQASNDPIYYTTYYPSKSSRSTLKKKLQKQRTKCARARFTPDEDSLLIQLRSAKLTWQEIYRRFDKRFPGKRSRGALQVRWSTKLEEQSFVLMDCVGN